MIGDMKGEDAAGNEVTLVERDSLRGEQMERNGVAGECIDDENVEVLRGFGGERGAGVAFDDIDRGSAIRECR